MALFIRERNYTKFCSKFYKIEIEKEIDENLNKIDGNFCLKKTRRKAQN